MQHQSSIDIEEYIKAVDEMFEAARCALWHATEHPDWRPCNEETCPCENYQDSMSVIVETRRELLKRVKS